ncbi:MAG: transporter [Gemmatimonadales bacterium]
MTLLALVASSTAAEAQIQDNSFLLEEAYNQERGVVQHISTFQRTNGGDWEYGFTQEWPLGGMRHQLSYTIPVQRANGFGTGLGDVALHYRYQLAGHPEAKTVMAPRVSILFPTGSEERGRGAGATGFQGNLPLSLVLGSRLVSHWNAGATATPSARNELGNRATTLGLNAGGSVIWLARPSFNLLVEAIWESTESVVGDGRTNREESWALSPGLRLAFDGPGGLQVVPGLAYTIGLGPASNEDALFLYLSLEHPFKR